MKNEKWKMKNEKWKMKNEKWKKRHGQKEIHITTKWKRNRCILRKEKKERKMKEKDKKN